VRVKLTTRLPGAGSRAAQFNSVNRLITAAPNVPVVREEPQAARADRTPPAPTPYGQPYGAPVDQEAYRQPAPARDTVQITALVAQAQQSLARREFRRAAGLAENVLALDPSNGQARDIRRRAQEGEKRAFEEIKIE